MKRPARGEPESATTTREAGRLVVPVRLSRIVTATFSPPRRRKSWEILQAGKLPLHALELLHDLPQLRELLEKPVHVLHARAAAARDPLAAAAVDDLGIAPLARRHRADDRVEPAEIRRLAVEILGRALEHLAKGKHAEDLIERTHLAELLDLLAEVLQRERVLAELPSQLLRLRLVHGRLRLLDEREHVPHAEDARGQAVGMERLERVGLLAPADEGDGAPGDGPDGERSATPRIAAEVGEDGL